MLRGANSIPNGIISSNLFILRNDAIRDHIPRSTSACNYAYCTVHTASLNKNSRLQVFTRVSKCLNTILCTSNIRGYYRTPYVGLTMVTKWLPHAVVYSTEIHFSSYISTWCLKHLWGLKKPLNEARGLRRFCEIVHAAFFFLSNPRPGNMVYILAYKPNSYAIALRLPCRFARANQM
jgi:hypothetical protein